MAAQLQTTNCGGFLYRLKHRRFVNVELTTLPVNCALLNGQLHYFSHTCRTRKHPRAPAPYRRGVA